MEKKYTRNVAFILAFIFFVCFSQTKLFSQTAIFYDGFEASNSGWKLGSVSANNNTNEWNIWNHTGFVLAGTQSLYIMYTENGGVDWYPGYTDNVSTKIIASKFIDARTKINLKLEFQWECFGEAGYDYGEVGYSTDSGTTFYWFKIGGYNNTGLYHSQSTVLTQNLYLPDSLSNRAFTLGFRWRNDQGVNGGVPFVIDEMYVRTYPNSPPMTDFTSDTRKTVVGSVVNFIDKTSFKPTTWTWTFPGGTPSSSNLKNPVIKYNTKGTYDVTLKAYNSKGFDIETKTGYIVIDTILYYADFESDDWSWYQTGNNYWDSAYNSFTNWYDPTYAIKGSGSLTIANTYDYGMNWSLGYANLQWGSYLNYYRTINAIGNKNMTLEFRWKCQGEQNIDFGMVGISTDSAATGANLAGGYNNTGLYFNQLTDTVQVLYLPDSLDNRVFSFGFRWQNDNANSYPIPFTIDEVKIKTHPYAPPIADFTASSTYILQGSTIKFQDKSVFKPTKWQWTFNGGIPYQSNLKDPSVVYSKTGIYEVKLKASNQYGSDSIIKTDYIIVDSCQNTVVRIFIHTDNNGYQTAWSLRDKNNPIPYDSVPFNTYENNKDYTHDICVNADSTLIFTIYDAGGDGICCDWGNGYYKIMGYCNLYAEGGDFASFDKKQFKTFSRYNPPNYQFEKIYGGQGNDVCSWGEPTCEGGYIIAGVTENNSIGKLDLLMLKIAPSGDTLWSKTFGTKRDDQGNCIRQTSDGGYVIVGSKSISLNNNDIYIIKTNSKGDTIWTKTYGGPYNDWGRTIIETSDGGFAIASRYAKTSDSDPNRWYNPYLLRLDYKGDTIWTKQYDGYNSLLSIEQTSDNGFISFHWFKDHITGQWSPRLLRTDKDGKVLWTNNVTPPFNPYYEMYINNLHLMSDGSMVFVDYGFDFSGKDYSMAYKLNSSGNIIWSKDLPGYITSIDETDSGCIIFGGNQKDTTRKQILVILYKTNADGDSLWANNLGLRNNLNYFVSSFYNMNSGGFVVFGSCYDVTDNKLIKGNIYILKTDENGKGCFYDTYEGQQLCMVTVDPTSGKNLVVWDKTGGMHTSYYNIWKETTSAGKYDKIGSIPFDSLSVFVDTSSNPAAHADRYKISLVNVCNRESRLSAPHKTMHLQINQGIAGENNLSWNQYEGFNFPTYKILRGSKPDKLQMIADIQSDLNSFSDVDPPNGKIYYQVVFVKNDTCYPAITRGQTSQGPYSQSVSNLKDYGIAITPYLAVSPDMQTIGKSEGSSATYTIATSIDSFSVTADQSWVNINTNTQAKFFIATANSLTDVNRESNITITGNQVNPITVKLRQGVYTAVKSNPDQEPFIVYPNPFTGKTTISYSVANKSDVSIEVFNTMGVKVADIVNERQNSGHYKYTFSPEEQYKSTGVYYLRFNSGKEVFVKKLTEL